MILPIPVFAGPSLWGKLPLAPPFVLYPPAAAGDLVSLLAEPPARLCLIDGLFDGCAAPWHKEILLLMAAGTRIYGAASMGALRAAELDGLGMIGVGVIYAAYRRGLLKGDDEVALAHGPEKWQWRPLSVPMVEVRATLIAARRQHLLTSAVAREIRKMAEVIPYAERDWQRLAQEGRRIAGHPVMEQLASMHIKLKQQDAIACLERCANDRGSVVDVPAPPMTYFIRQLARWRGVEHHLP